jgi:hypothetical protein
MNTKSIRIPANENEIRLYSFVGEAIWKIQLVEQALSFAITLKMKPDANKEEAEKVLEQYQKLTLGKAVRQAEKYKIFDSAIEEDLKDFLNQRNWMVHHSLAESSHGKNWEDHKEMLFQRIKSISDDAERIQRKIEYDLLEFCKSEGRDMSNIYELLKLQEQVFRIVR